MGLIHKLNTHKLTVYVFNPMYLYFMFYNASLNALYFTEKVINELIKL